MYVLGEDILQYLGFSFLACIVLQVLNYARKLVVVRATHELPALSDSLVHGNCIICRTPINLGCSWWKSFQYCSPKCKLIHWRKERKERQTLNESVIAANGLKPQQTPHIHGNKTKQCITLVGKSEKQSSTKEDAPNFFFSQDGTSISKSAPEYHYDITRGLGKTKKVNDSSVKVTSSKFQSSTDQDISLNESIELWLFGKPINKWKNHARNLVQDSEFAKSAFKEVSHVKVMTKMDSHDKLTPDLLVKEAKVEVPAEPEEPASGDKTVSHNCATCSAPTKTRCSRCKSVHYCSGKCQIRHWRSGHKEKCKPLSKPTSVASRLKSPMQMDSQVNFNLLPYGIDTNKYGIQEGTAHDLFGIQIEDRFMNSSQKGAVSKLKGEDNANQNSSYFNNSLEESNSSAAIKENLQNLDGTVSKTQQNCDESTEVLGKKYKQTSRHVQTVCSNPDANMCADIEGGMLNRDENTTKQVEEEFSKRSPIRETTGTKKTSFSREKSFHVLKERKDKIITQKIENKFSQEISKLKQEFETKCTKLQNLEKIQAEALKENRVLQTMQQDIGKGLEHLCQEKEKKVSKDGDTTNCMEFSYLELREATSNFDEKLKIGEGGYGSVYRGVLHCTTVAIKVLHSGGYQGDRIFYKEVEVLRKVRHPNIVTLIGECSQINALVYEFLPNGSLENYLNSASNRKLLYWKTRIEIASNVFSALIFLHSTKPHGIVHGDLKPANILLDSNYQGKLSDFRTSCQLMKTHETIESHHLIEHLKGTRAYIDPEYIQTGEVTVQSDVYSFGIILLQLVTGKPAAGICKLMQEALKIQGLHNEIDVSAKWPSEKAIKMVKLGLRCCNTTRKNRPNLATEVWSEIESLKQDASR